jgi:hypothetical protein
MRPTSCRILRQVNRLPGECVGAVVEELDAAIGDERVADVAGEAVWLFSLFNPLAVRITPAPLASLVGDVVSGSEQDRWCEGRSLRVGIPAPDSTGTADGQHMRAFAPWAPERHAVGLHFRENGREEPGHASLLDIGMPATTVISFGLPTITRPSGQRRATHRDFSSRMMLTLSPWLPPSTW